MKFSLKISKFLLLFIFGILLSMLTLILNKYIGYTFSFSLISFLIFLILFQTFPQYFNLKYLLPTSIYIWSFIFIIFIPSEVISYTNLGEIFNPKYLISTSSVLIFVPLGILIGHIFFKISEKDSIYFKNYTFEKFKDLKFLKSFFYFLLSFSFILLIYYISVTTTLPIIELIKNPHNFRYLMSLREEALKLLNVSSIFIYIFRWLRIIISPILVIVSFYIYLVEKRKIWIIITFIMIIFTSFICLTNLEKIPIISLFLSLGFFLYQINRKTQKLVIIFIFLSFFSAFLITYFANISDVGLFGSIKNLFLRAFYTPSYTVFQYFEVFPSIHDFLYGRGIKILSYILNLEFFDEANFVYRIYFPEKLESGLVNTCFVGDAYANFNIYGVFIEGILLGLLLNFLNFSILKLFFNKDTKFFSLLFQSILFPILIISLNSSPLTSSLLTGGIIPSFIIIFLINLLYNLKMKKK